MASLKVDLQPNSIYWNNQANPVLFVNSSDAGLQSGQNAIQSNNSGVNSFTVNLNSFYNTLPIVSQLSTFQFQTYNDSNSENVNQDWFVRFILSNDIVTQQFSIYPRNSTDFNSAQDQWITINQSVLQLDLNGTLYDFGNFTTGAYSNYKITQIIVSTEGSSINKITDISLGFTGVQSLDFIVNQNTNNVIIGASDSLIAMQNKQIQFLSGNQNLLSIDGENNKLVVQSVDLVVQSSLNLNGNVISGVANPVDQADATTKQYVDDYFDQLVSQLQWFNASITSNNVLNFTSGNLTQDLNLLTTVNPEPLNNTIQKLSNNTFKLLASSFRVEFSLKVNYATMQSQPVSILIREIDQNGDLVAGSALNYSQITSKPFAMDQVVTSQVFTTLVVNQETRFKVSIQSEVQQDVTIMTGSSIYINRLFDQNQSGNYQPISTQSIPLNQIITPTGNVSLNTHKIINLADPTNNQEAATKIYVDTLNNNTNTYIDTQIAGTFTQAQADNLYYSDSTTLNNLTAPTGDLDLNSVKIVNLANATLATDALNRQTADSRYYQSTVALNNLTAPSANLSLNSRKITNLANATLATDALNQQSGDNRYYLLSDTLNSIQLPTGNVSLNTYKITNLGTPTMSTDASTKDYVDTQIANIVNSAPTTLDTLNELSIALNNDANFSTTISTLIGTKFASADFNSTFATRYAATSINSALPPTSSLSLNSQKITNLANATLATDALNRQTGDGRYYLATTVLNSITAPTSSLSLNSQKITNLATPTLSTDATTKGYVDTLMSGISSAPVGSIFMYINVSPPTNYLICNGDSLSRTTYSTLFALIGTQYGTASVTTFNLPDFRGVVPRGFNDTAADTFSDPERTSRVARYAGGATGNVLGSYQQDEFESHQHQLQNQFGSGTSNSSQIERASGASGQLYTDVTGGGETRMKNVYVIFIIKVQ